MVGFIVIIGTIMCCMIGLTGAFVYESVKLVRLETESEEHNA